MAPRTSSNGIKIFNPKKTNPNPNPVVSTIYDQGYQPTPGMGAGGSASYWERINQGIIDRMAPGAEPNPLEIPTPTTTYNGINASDLAAILAASGSGSGSSSNAVANQLARDKFNYDKSQDASEFNYRREQDAIATAKSAATLKAMQDRYASGGYRENADKLLSILSGQETTGRGQIKTTYDDAIANILGGYKQAQDVTTQGYNALDEYLANNQSNPYAGYQSQVGSVTNPMESLLAAYGVGAEPVRAQVEAEQLAGQQGGNAFQDLMNILSASATRGNQSRASESQMARNLAGANLGAASSAYQSQAANTQQKALADLLNQIAQSQFSVEQGVGENADALANAILAAGGSTGSGVPAGGVPATGGSTEPIMNLPDLNPGLYNPGVASGIDESTRVPEVTPDILEELRKSLAGLGSFGQGFLTR
tara:strand:- start:344 stop:1615 length:1272 start_codon:yes stop_codon:yes gene_type:complete